MKVLLLTVLLIGLVGCGSDVSVVSPPSTAGRSEQKRAVVQDGVELFSVDDEGNMSFTPEQRKNVEALRQSERLNSPSKHLFEHVESGMTLDEVNAIIGSAGTDFVELNELSWKSDGLENRTIYVWGAGIDPWCCLFEDHKCVAVAYYNMEVTRAIRDWLCGDDETFTPHDGTTTYVF